MVDYSATLPRPELIQVADTVARDKGIDKEEVFQAMEQAIQKAGRSRYGLEHDIRANINRKTGEIKLLRYREIVDTIENTAVQITLKDAVKIKHDASIGDFITDELPPVDFGRIAAQTAKQVIVQKVRDAERNRQYEEFKNRVGEIINGIAKRVEFGNIVVDIGKNEAVLKREEMIPRETFRNGDRVRAYVLDVRQEPRGPQIFLSRTCPEFMQKLFASEVPEIYDGIVEIKSVARDAGSRAKIAVVGVDSSIDPVGACVGLRGSRVQAVVSELQGEKIDIVQWSPDKATLIVNALAPAEVAKVVFDEENNKIEVVVPDEQLSLAIGRRGQNVKLASILIGSSIDILTEKEESERRQKEIKIRSQRFIDALDVDDVIARLLVDEGFTSVDEIAYVPVADITDIEGFDEDVAKELQKRAKDYIEVRDKQFTKKKAELGISDELAALHGILPDMAVKLGEKGVLTLDDLGDLASDELIEILGENSMTENEANAVIMSARAHWFKEEDQA